MIYPGVEFKSIEGDTLFADADFNEIRPYLGVKPVAVHTQVARYIPEADQSRRDRWRMFHLAYP